MRNTFCIILNDKNPTVKIITYDMKKRGNDNIFKKLILDQEDNLTLLCAFKKSIVLQKKNIVFGRKIISRK